MIGVLRMLCTVMMDEQVSLIRSRLKSLVVCKHPEIAVAALEPQITVAPETTTTKKKE